MRPKYLKLVYCASLFLVSFSLSYYYRSIYNISSYKDMFKLGKEIDTLIIGDSHPMSALDPSIIRNSKNIALDSENYFFTYYKLRHYLSNNSQIRNVILGYSTHNVSKMSSEMFFFHEPTEKQVLSRYYRILDLEGKFRIMSFRKYFIISALKYDFGIPLEVYKDEFLIKKLIGNKIRESDYEFIGGFYNSEKTNISIEDIYKKIKEYYYNDNMIYPGESNFNLEFLQRIIEMCSIRGIRVYLYSSPVLPAYKEMIPEGNMLDFWRVTSELLKKYGNTIFIDHTDYKLEMKYYGDQDHVNSLGAKVVSQVLYERILNAGN